jgi:hypothetical protein
MVPTQRKKHFVWSVVVVFIIQLPLLLLYATDLVSFVLLISAFLAVAAVLGSLYLALVNKLNADRREPIPWVASPVVWLGVPLLVVVVIFLMP